MKQGVLVLVAAALAAGGCLFPSFDDLKGKGAPAAVGDGAAEEDGGGGAASSGSTSSSGNASSSTSSSSSSSGTVDSGSDTGTTPGAQKIQCGASLTCDVATTFCCAKIAGDNECRPKGSGTGGCNSLLDCDGPEDCPGGQSCCQNGFGGSNLLCKSGGCGNAYTFCHPGVAGQCPAAEPSCSGDSIGIYGAEPTSCE